MSELIPLTAMIAENTCARLDRALFILEDGDDAPANTVFLKSQPRFMRQNS